MPPRVEWVMLWDDWLSAKLRDCNDLERTVYLTALTLCNRGPYRERKNGRLFVGPGVPVTCRHFAVEMDRPAAAVEKALQKLCLLYEEESLMYRDGAVYVVRNWRTRQRSDRPDTRE